MSNQAKKISVKQVFLTFGVLVFGGFAAWTFLTQHSTAQTQNITIAEKQDIFGNDTEATQQPESVLNVVEVEEKEELEPVATDGNHDVVELAAVSPQAGESVKPTSEAVDENTDASVNTDQVQLDQDVIKQKDYSAVFSFPVTEEKMKAFVITANKIDTVNRKWDMLISSAKTDTMAIEYIGLSNEEMAQVMDGIQGISLAEYKEIFAYAARDKEFNSIVNAFRQYYVVAPKLNKNQPSEDTTQVN